MCETCSNDELEQQYPSSYGLPHAVQAQIQLDVTSQTAIKEQKNLEVPHPPCAQAWPASTGMFNMIIVGVLSGCRQVMEPLENKPPFVWSADRLQVSGTSLVCCVPSEI